MTTDPHDVTEMLTAIRSGKSRVSDALLPVVYDELKRLARSQMSHENEGHTLQPTALVHEAYLRLLGPDGDARELEWDNRGHFFAAAALSMRRILVERARSRNRIKRGGGRKREPLSQTEQLEEPEDGELLVLDDVLGDFEAHDERKYQVVMLKYFAGLSIDEVGAALAISPTTVKADWRYAKAWLHRAMAAREAEEADG